MTTPGKKYDQDKAPVVQGCFHYFPNALLAVAFISKFGAEKYQVPYSDRNFAKVDDASNRYMDALGRHLLADAIDGPYDPESGYLHAAHDAWDALARLEMMLTKDKVPLRNPEFDQPMHPKTIEETFFPLPQSEQPKSEQPTKNAHDMFNQKFRERVASMNDDWQKDGTDG